MPTNQEPAAPDDHLELSPAVMRLQAGRTVALLDPVGGRLTSLVVGGRELLVQSGADIFHWGSFPMAPWVGRVRHGRFRFGGEEIQLPLNSPPHALHGLVTDRTWTALAPGQLALELAEPWPWPCRVLQSVTLFEERMDFTLEIQAKQPMPADVGWHPWFNRQLVDAGGAKSDPIEVIVDPQRMYLNDDEDLPTGALGRPAPHPWDYCFIELPDPPVVRWDDVLELTILSDCSHWVIYEQEDPGVCVEPWTGPPDSFNLANRRIVTADQPLRATMSWTWRHLAPSEPGTS